jgi:alpha/beta superfamily hydrolase
MRPNWVPEVVSVTIGHDASSESTAMSVAEDGATEFAEFRGPPGERLFCYFHVPASTPRGAVVVCSPLHGEFARNYRREVLLARALAGAGHAVLRFHYRYTGNSDGDGVHLTFDSMRADALTGIEWLSSEMPEVPIALVGTRWGSLVAASAASLHPDVTLAFWEPLVTASSFFKDAFLSRRVREVRRGVDHPSTDQELEERLLAGEGVDVVAHRLEPALFRSSLDRTLEGELGSTPRRVLAVQVGPTGAVRADLAQLTQRWEAIGLQVDAVGLKGEETWWLVEERYDQQGERPVALELVELTTDWISKTAEVGA